MSDSDSILIKIDDIVNGFQNAWDDFLHARRNSSPSIGEYLDKAPKSWAPADVEELFRALLDEDLGTMRNMRKPPPWKTYQRRFPQYKDLIDERIASTLPPANIRPSDAGPRNPAAPLPFIGTDYQVLELLKTGGMGEVYKAWQSSLNREVAVKIMKQVGDKESEKRFLREAKALSALKDPNIVVVYDFGKVPAGGYFLVMELVNGPNLAQLVALEGRFSIDRAVSVVCEIAGAIHFVNENNIIHRDLKPANILCHKDDRYKDDRFKDYRYIVTDFGLAKLLSDNPADPLTTDSQALGTPNYMPPEQVNRKFGEFGPRSDVYGLGGILYALLTGQPPYSGTTVDEVINKVVSPKYPAAPHKVRRDVPRRVSAVCMRCLRKYPVKRYPSARDVREALEKWRHPGPTHPPRRMLRRVVPFLLAVPIIGGLIALGLGVLDGSRSRPGSASGLTATLVEADGDTPVGASPSKEEVRGSASVEDQPARFDKPLANDRIPFDQNGPGMGSDIDFEVELNTELPNDERERLQLLVGTGDHVYRTQPRDIEFDAKRWTGRYTEAGSPGLKVLIAALVSRDDARYLKELADASADKGGFSIDWTKTDLRSGDGSLLERANSLTVSPEADDEKELKVSVLATVSFEYFQPPEQ